MSNRDRFANIALGIVVGIAIALVFLVWAVPEFREPTNQQKTHISFDQQHARNERNESGQQPMWREWSERIFVLQDTVAQWLMAVFAVVATGVSIWAVRLVRATLEESRKAVHAANETVRITREVGMAQIRAYLTLREDPDYRAGAGSFSVSGTVENSGQSPARQVEISGKLYWQRATRFKLFRPGEDTSDGVRYGKWGSADFTPAHVADVPIGKSSTFEFYVYGDEHPEIVNLIASNSVSPVYIQCTIKWLEHVLFNLVHIRLP